MKEMDGLYLVKGLTILGIGVAFLVHFVLLIFRIESNGDFSYQIIVMPIVISMTIVGIWSFIHFTYSITRNIFKAMEFLALLFLSVGSVWSYVQLSYKFDLVLDISILYALLPFMVSILLACLILVLLIMVKCIRYEVKEFKKTT
jgi:hypothetical protein